MVIAVKSEPAEVKPGGTLTYTALVAQPYDADAGAAVHWSYCTSPKAVAEDNAVAGACLSDTDLVLVGNGNPVDGKMPRTACANFGPDAARGGNRPRDPDGTGGYYQPLRVEIDSTTPTFHLSRVLCNLANAPAESARAFAEAYVPNRNPHLRPLTFLLDAHAVSPDSVQANSTLTLEASWAEADAESYVYFDPDSQSVVQRRESLQVAWFSTGGQFALATTARDSIDEHASVTNTWRAPPNGGKVRLWAVLHDNRGGVDFTEYEIVVAP